MNNAIEVTFWGVRGSHPVPGRDTLFFGGNTTCLEVTAGGIKIIIDSGTGIINLGKRLVADYFKGGGMKGLVGKVSEVNQSKGYIHVEKATIAKADGKAIARKIHPSNVIIVKLNLADPWRKEKLEELAG